jgi:hypothetical protein
MRDADPQRLVQLISIANEETKVRSAGETNESTEQVAPSVARTSECSTGKLNAASDCDARSYHAGLVFGAVTLVMALGVMKDAWALLKPSGEGVLVFGFLMVRYSSLYRVWFGYAFTGAAAWYATIPHVVLYGAGIYGLTTRRRWGWMLLSMYLLYIPLSEALYAVFGGFGYLGRPVIPAEILWAHVPYYIVLVVLVGLVEWRLWRCRDIFVH